MNARTILTTFPKAAVPMIAVFIHQILGLSATLQLGSYREISIDGLSSVSLRNIFFAPQKEPHPVGANLYSIRNASVGFTADAR